MIINTGHPHLEVVAFFVDAQRKSYWMDFLPIIGWYVPEPSERKKERGFDVLASAIPVTFESPSEEFVIHNKKTGRAWQPGCQSFASLDDAAAAIVPEGFALY